jgi:site-specific recombinase XerD
VTKKGQKLPAEPLDQAEIKALLAACGGVTLVDVRNHALLVVMWRSGLRCSEALDLRPQDIRFSDGSIRVLHGKGSKARTVGIDDSALAVLSVWVDRRQAAGIIDGPLFCTLEPPGRPLATRYVRTLMTRLGRKAGIGHRVHPHGLRHTLAVELCREGWPVPLISRQLGHTNVATTETYLAGLHPREVIDRARVRSWSPGGPA